MKVTRMSRFGWAWTSQPVRGSNGRLEIPKPTRPEETNLSWKQLTVAARKAVRINSGNYWNHSVFCQGRRLSVRVFDLIADLELNGSSEVDTEAV